MLKDGVPWPPDSPAWLKADMASTGIAVNWSGDNADRWLTVKWEAISGVKALNTAGGHVAITDGSKPAKKTP